MGILGEGRGCWSPTSCSSLLLFCLGAPKSERGVWSPSARGAGAGLTSCLEMGRMEERWKAAPALILTLCGVVHWHPTVRQGTLHPSPCPILVSAQGGDAAGPVPARCTGCRDRGARAREGAAKVDALLVSLAFSSRDQRAVKRFGREVTLKTASFEQRKGQEPSAMVIAHGGEGHVAAPCLSPRSLQLSASNSSPRLQRAAFPPGDLDPGWAGSRGEGEAPTQLQAARRGSRQHRAGLGLAPFGDF